MNRYRKYLPQIVAALVGAATLSAPSQARATFNVSIYDDGSLVPVLIIPTGPTSVFFQTPTGTAPDFFASGTANIQMSGNGTLSVSYNSAVTAMSGGTHTLTLLVTNTGYSLPAGTPVLLKSSGGGSYVGRTGDSVNGNTLGFLDPNNISFGDGTGGTVAVTPVTGVVAPNGHSTPNSTTGNVNGNSGSQSLVYTPPTGSALVTSMVPFSLTNVSYFTFTQTAGNGDSANISNSLSTESATTPAPAGIVLALTGMPFLGFGAWWRRRRQAV